VLRHIAKASTAVVVAGLFAVGCDPNVGEVDDTDPLAVAAAECTLENGCLDPDGDGLSDAVEAAIGTNPAVTDCDGDGIHDGNDDLDGDGLTNLQESGYGGQIIDTDSDGIPNPLDPDDDGDGISTLVERQDAAALNHSFRDADGDGSANWLDTDSDGDGAGDSQEGRGDVDGDGLRNYLDASTVVGGSTCTAGTYAHNGTCVSSCPSGTSPWNGACTTVSSGSWVVSVAPGPNNSYVNTYRFVWNGPAWPGVTGYQIYSTGLLDASVPASQMPQTINLGAPVVSTTSAASAIYTVSQPAATGIVVFMRLTGTLPPGTWSRTEKLCADDANSSNGLPPGCSAVFNYTCTATSCTRP
jgi:hypothetical protein